MSENPTSKRSRRRGDAEWFECDGWSIEDAAVGEASSEIPDYVDVEVQDELGEIHLVRVSIDVEYGITKQIK